MKFKYQFPKATQYDGVLSVSKLSSKAGLSAKLKAELKYEVDNIIWAYKLSPKTTNIPDCDAVKEIQVAVLKPATPKFNPSLLKAIDKVIPSPVLFQFKRGIELRYAMAYKRPSKTSRYRLVVGDYFWTPWMIDCEDYIKARPLPTALNLGLLYRAFLSDLSQIPPREGEALGDFAERAQSLQSKQRLVEHLRQQHRNYDHNQLKQHDISERLSQLRHEINRLSS